MANSTIQGASLTPAAYTYNISKGREKTIDNAVANHLDGKLSYAEALKKAESRGVSNGISYGFTAIINGHFFESLNNMLSTELRKARPDSIHMQFEQALHNEQIKRAKASLTTLQHSTLTLNDTQSQIHLQQTFSNLYFENRIYKVSINSLYYDKKTCQLKIKLETLNKSNGESTINEPGQKIFINQSQANSILIEYAIYRHKQFGQIGNNQYEVTHSVTDNELSNFTKQLLTTLDENGFDEKSNRNWSGRHNKDTARYVATELKKNITQHWHDGLSLGGGGAKGIGYVGVVEALGDFRLLMLKKVTGASAGAITATLLACGMKTFEFKEFAATTNLKDLDQPELIKQLNSQYNKNIKARLTEYQQAHGENASVEKNEKINEWLSKVNDQNFKLTLDDLERLRKDFPDLGFKAVMLTATLDGAKDPVEVELSHNTFPNMALAEAAAASAALPGKFEPISIAADNITPQCRKELGITHDGPIKVKDGGILNNVPYLELAQDSNIKNPLNLSFEKNRGLYNNELTTVEKIKDVGSGHPCYEIMRCHIYDLETNYNIHFVKTPNVETLNFDRASQKIFALTNSVKNEFIEYELNSLSTNFKPRKVITAEDKMRLKQLQTLTVLYYQKDKYTRKILDTEHPIHKKTYLELLRNEQDNAQFQKLSKEVTTRIDELKAITLKDIVIANIERVHKIQSAPELTI